MTTEQRKRDVALVVDDSPETLRLLTDALVERGRVALARGELRVAADTFRRVEQLVLEQWVDVLGDRGRHARSTVGVAELPLDAAVEVEALFEVR